MFATDTTEPIDGGDTLLLSISPSLTILLFRLPVENGMEDERAGGHPPPPPPPPVEAMELNADALLAASSVLVLLRE